MMRQTELQQLADVQNNECPTKTKSTSKMRIERDTEEEEKMERSPEGKRINTGYRCLSPGQRLPEVRLRYPRSEMAPT